MSAEHQGQVAAVVTSNASFTPTDLHGDVFGLKAQVERGSTTALRSDDGAVIAAALSVLDGHAATVHLLPSSMGAAEVPGDVTTLTPHLEATVSAPSEVAEPEYETEWVVYTSGTTGLPKPIVHTTATLSRTVVASARSAELRWGLLYDPNRMAGLQVLLQALHSGATVIAPDLHQPLATRVQMLADEGTTALSATPTLWRLILQTPGSAALPLRQITLGGEIADQRILDALAARYPEARIVHVFASTETGAAFSVTDGRAGFPASYLDEAPKGIRLEVRDAILHIHSPGVSTSDGDGFASTGDIVEVTDDRVLFKGRASGVVNVGGANVWPEEVEILLRQHDDVVEAVVTAKDNALSGNILIASVVARPDVDTKALRKGLRAWVRDRAPGTHVPAMIKVVDQLDVSQTGKVVR